MLSDKVTELLSGSDNLFFTVTAQDKDGNGPKREVNGEENKKELKPFNTNLTGLIRLRSQGEDPDSTTAYAIMYLVIVGYTGVFTFMYFKRFLYIAFLTMIAPLVALTYPIDKARRW